MATLTSTKNPTIIRNPNPEPRRILTLPKKTAPVITRDPNFVPGSSYVAPVNSNPNANIAPGYLSPELYNQQVNVGNMYNQDYQQAANSIIGLSDAFYQPLMADQAKFEQLNAAIGAEQTQNLMDIQRQIESQY
jgi:hypothetical protein